VQDAGIGLGNASRHLRDSTYKPKEKEKSQQWQTWLWASLAVLATGAMGLYAGRKVAGKQREACYSLLEDRSDEERSQLRSIFEELSSFDIIMRNKAVLLTKTAFGILFRAIDIGLDTIAGIKFYSAGDEWWCAITFTIISLSPLPSFAYVKYKRGCAAKAAVYLIPGSFAHLRTEISQWRFISKLPQVALFGNVHKAVATSTFNEVLAGLECAFESLPQAILQSRAYVVNGGDWVNILSIAFSLFGVVTGVVFGLKAIFTKSTQKGVVETGHNLVLQEDIVLELSAGQSVDLSAVALDRQTKEAVIWLAAAEKIFPCGTSLEIPVHAMTSWNNSPQHANSLLQFTSTVAQILAILG
jgi:hypothetical protein